MNNIVSAETKDKTSGYSKLTWCYPLLCGLLVRSLESLSLEPFGSFNLGGFKPELMVFRLEGGARDEQGICHNPK